MGHSIIYPGLHYLLFSFLEKLQITDPQMKMTVVRVLHAFYSMLTVFAGYRIAAVIADKRQARIAGLVLALLWILPVLSVRNLIEMVCIPPAMLGLYFGIKGDKTKKLHFWIFAGLAFGLAFAFRYQTILFPAAMGLVLIIQRRGKPLAVLALSTVAGLFLLQGITDWIAWGYPFAAFLRYLAYNIQGRYSFIVAPWYNYLILLAGALIPPISFLWLFGYLRTWKKAPLLFFPTLIFLLFHSYFPNKQERFILPAVPLIIILGICGWLQYAVSSEFWQKHFRLHRGIWAWFWVVNLILLFMVTPAYTKKNRVESLYQLSKQPDVKAVVFESSRSSTPNPPTFYLNKEVPIYPYPKGFPAEKLQAEILRKHRVFPNYIIFLGQKNIEERVKAFERDFNKKLERISTIHPSFIDKLLHRLNPEHNVNQTSYIYRINPA
ncbi:MAG: glycosyltransferase family 39 protein [Calditrichia bacterium]